jgi:hypothetical protein
MTCSYSETNRHSVFHEVLIHVQSYGRVVYLICTSVGGVSRVIENDLLLLTDESNTQHVSRTVHEGVPRVIKNDLLLLTDESNTQHVDRTGRE